MHFFRLFILAVFVCGCSRGNFSRNALRIGIDPNWYVANFGPQTAYVNGYTEDVLLEISRYSGMQFELVRANNDSLFDGMKKGEYDAVITTLPAYEYNLAKYDFSENLLDLGPVLIIPHNSNQTSLSKLSGDLVGVLTNDPAELVLAKYPTLIVRTYPSIPALLNAVTLGDIQGALLDFIPAVNYVSDLYADVLQIAGRPLTTEGIRLIGPKGGIDAFNKNLTSVRRKSTLQKLQKKWELGL